MQINSKIRARLMMGKDMTKEEIETAAKADPEIAAQLEGKTIKKCVVVPGRLVNFIIG